MPRLIYLPLEGYKARYTMQWSAPKTGWLERNWIKAGIDYSRIDGKANFDPNRTIKAGVVLDAVTRSTWAMSQVERVIKHMEDGDIKTGDIIYFDDFWHPGIEAVRYCGDVLGVRPKLFAFLHAQSVDEFDFTFPMRGWMRHFEKGIAAICDGIFVCGHTLKDLVVHGGICGPEKVFVTGHPFNSEEVLERMPLNYRLWMNSTGNEDVIDRAYLMPRKNKVVYSSRWDAEKNPFFFMDVFTRLTSMYDNFEFVVCTSSQELRSNHPTAVQAARDLAKKDSRFVIKENLTKEEYYAELCTAKIQMNTADQDFVAITLLEAMVAGCYPIYPYFRSFPETFDWRAGYMYERLDVQNAANMVYNLLVGQDHMWSRTAIQQRQWIYKRYDTSWLRMLTVMGLRADTDLEPTTSSRFASNGRLSRV